MVGWGETMVPSFVQRIWRRLPFTLRTLKSPDRNPDFKTMFFCLSHNFNAAAGILCFLFVSVDVNGEKMRLLDRKKQGTMRNSMSIV